MPNKKRLIGEFIELVKIDSLTGKEKTLANLLVKKLKEIGFEVIFEGYDENPAKWVDTLADANSVKTDFFEAKSTAYAKASVLIDDL